MRPRLGVGLRNLLVSGQGMPWSGVWSLGDQALVSATNFITMVLLARTLAPERFGVFLLVYMALLFANELQKSLVTRPHNVLAARLSDARYASFTATSAAFQAYFAGVCGALALLAGGVAHVQGWGIAGLLLASGPAIVAWQMQEFVRQTFYTKGRADKAFACDTISYAGQAAVILLLLAADALTGVTALYALASTSALSALFGFWLIRREIGLPEVSDLREAWRFGRWLVGDGVGGWLSSQLYPLFTAAIVGVSGVAVLRAVQNLVAPGHIVMNAFLAYAVPRASRVRGAQGDKAMKAFVLQVCLIAGAPLAIYWLVVSLLAGPALRLLYGDTYSGYGLLVALTALVYAVHYVTLAQSAALLALGRTDVMFGGRVVAILITFTAGVLLVWWLGIYGAVIGSGLSLAGLGLFLARSLGRSESADLPVESLTGAHSSGLAVEGEI